MSQTQSGIVYQVLEERPGGWAFAWHIEYLSGVIKKGGWNCDAADLSMQAWMQPGENILRAYIMAMDKNRVKCMAAECSGQDFFGFEWHYAGKITGAGKVSARVAGLTLLTQSERVTIFESGKATVTPFSPVLINKYPQGR